MLCVLVTLFYTIGEKMLIILRVDCRSKDTTTFWITQTPTCRDVFIMRLRYR